VKQRNRLQSAPMALGALIFVYILISGCGSSEKISKLFLAQAQFIYQKGDDGKDHPVPGPARLVIYTSGKKGWSEEVLEDPDSNVFHKALWFAPPQGDPGILTIGATKAFLKIWRKSPAGWSGESYWNPVFGGKFDRLRDVEIGDVNGDKIPDIVMATHDQGVVAAACWKDGKYQIQELGRKENTFVHEIEIGDIDGDGINEIFSTPSLPNKLDGTPQPGEIDMYSFKNGQWTQSKVDVLESRHAKEILCVTLDGDSRSVLLASLEGENLGGAGDSGDTTRIRLYSYDNGKFASKDIATLPSQLCRFLNYGDVDGDGKKDLIASTKSSGIFKLSQGDPEWKSNVIISDSSGFEHATYLADLDGDKTCEIYVASDDQGEMRVYRRSKTGYSKEVIGKLKEHAMTFNITAWVP
jgi:hypothetical protein